MVLFKSWKRLMAAGLFLVGAGVAAIQPAEGHVFVRFGPPPPRVERIGPVPHPGWVWLRGRWTWDGAHWVWAPGYWTPPPAINATWVPGHWKHHARGWIWIEGHWV